MQVYAPTSNAEEADVERFYEDLQDMYENEVNTNGKQSCNTEIAISWWNKLRLKV